MWADTTSGTLHRPRSIRTITSRPSSSRRRSTPDGTAHGQKLWCPFARRRTRRRSPNSSAGWSEPRSAGRIDANEHLNTVALYLPFYDSDTVEKIVKRLTGDPGIMPPTKVREGKESVMLQRNAGPVGVLRHAPKSSELHGPAEPSHQAGRATRETGESPSSDWTREGPGQDIPGTACGGLAGRTGSARR